jgi:hypothetical protein
MQIGTPNMPFVFILPTVCKRLVQNEDCADIATYWLTEELLSRSWAHMHCVWVYCACTCGHVCVCVCVCVCMNVDDGSDIEL